MATLTRDVIMGIPPKTETLDVPEWGGEIIIRELTVGQQERISKGSKTNIDLAMKAFLEGVVDPRFEPGDYDALKERGGAGMSRVVNRILELSGMKQESADEISGK